MSEFKASVVCTITGCNQRFELPIERDLWGMLTWSDLAEITVTAPVTSEFTAHQEAHRRDGSFHRHFVDTARSLGMQADKIAEQIDE